MVAAISVFKNGKRGNEALLLQQRSSPSPSRSSSAAAANDAFYSLSDSKDASSWMLPKHNSKKTSNVFSSGEKETKDEKANAESETTLAAVGNAETEASSSSSNGDDDDADQDNDDLLELRSRIFSEQPLTWDTTRHGAKGRFERTEPLRAVAVSAELEYRRRSRNTNGLSSLPPSPISRSLFPPVPLAPSHTDYVAVCVILKDQSVDLPEFVAWYTALGVKTFYLFDDGSSPAVSPEQAASALPPATRSETKVVVTPLTGEMISRHPTRRPQMAAYDSCVASYRAEHEWLAFFDVDEFVVISSNASFLLPSAATSGKPSSSVPSLPLLLSRYEGAAAALGLHWSMFGSAGRTARKPDSMLTAEAFESCLPADSGSNRHVKTIASTRMLDISESCMGPHHFAFWDFEKAVSEAEEESEKKEMEKEKSEADVAVVAGSPSLSPALPSLPQPPPPRHPPHPHRRRRPQPFTVDVEGTRIDGPYSRPSTPGGKPPKVPRSPAFLAHFALKSKEDFETKMARGSGMRNRKGWPFFNAVDGASTQTCSEASELAKKIRESGAIVLPASVA